MSGLGKREIGMRTKAMDTEEQQLALRVIPDYLLKREIARREAVRADALNQIMEVTDRLKKMQRREKNAMITTDYNQMSCEELEQLHTGMGTEFQINDGKIVGLESKGN